MNIHSELGRNGNMMKCLAGLAITVLLYPLQLNAAEVSWQKDIKPVFGRQCAGCHGKDSPEYGEYKKDKLAWKNKGIGMRMDTHSSLIAFVGWPDAGALMRRLDDGSSKTDKKAGNMYMYLGTDEAERTTNLNIFKAWVGSWNLKRWNEITKEELDAIKAKY